MSSSKRLSKKAHDAEGVRNQLLDFSFRAPEPTPFVAHCQHTNVALTATGGTVDGSRFGKRQDAALPFFGW